jgi:N-acetylmuramoyl-L-alanine amidase
MPSVPRPPRPPRPPHVPHVGHVPHVPHVPHARMMSGLDSGQSGDAILAHARGHIGEQYSLGARAPMSNADWKGPWDCAEFVSWCVYQASGILFGVEPRHDAVRADAYTGFWADQAHAANALITVEQAAGIAGAAVLRIPQSGKIGHIVLSDGKGGSVEAHSSARGVCQNTLSGRRWDVGILVPGVRYFASDTVVPVKPPAEVLRLSDPMTRGDRVRAIQACLNELGFAAGAADGVFGPQTEWAVRSFQNGAGLVADGEVGKATLAALKAKKCKIE